MAKAEYSIGKVAKLLGLSIEGIRSYERAGIISSRRTDENSYRKYSYLDITSLVRARMYRAFGFSLSETELLTNQHEIDDILTALHCREEKIRMEIVLQKAKLSLLEELTEKIEEIENMTGDIELCKSPSSYRMEFSKNGEIDYTEETVANFRRFVDCLPFSRISSRYSEVNVYGGLAIDADFASLCGLETSGGKIQYLPSQLCLKLVISEEENGFADSSRLEPLYEFADYHRFHLSKDLIGYTILGISKSKAYRRYREIYAPVLPEK